MRSVFRSRSSFWIDMVTEGWARPIRSAARLTLPSRATARKARACWISISDMSIV